VQSTDHGEDLLGIADALPGGDARLVFQLLEVARVGRGEGVDASELAVLNHVPQLVGPEVDLRRLGDLREHDQVSDRDGVFAAHRLPEVRLKLSQDRRHASLGVAVDHPRAVEQFPGERDREQHLDGVRQRMPRPCVVVVGPSQEARQGLRAELSENRLRAEDVGEDVALGRDPGLDRPRTLDAQVADRPSRFRTVGVAEQLELLGVDPTFQLLTRPEGRRGRLDGLGELLEIIRAGLRGKEQRTESREQASNGQSSMPK
jgi:hypothetical protein